MLQRVKYLLPATDRIFLDDRKYQDLTVDRYENKLIDSIFHALNGFQKLTDILAADKDVTASSFISLLRFIYELTSADEEDNATSSQMKKVIRDYIASKLATHGGKSDAKLRMILRMFLRVVEVLDPTFLQISTVEDDEAQTCQK